MHKIEREREREREARKGTEKERGDEIKKLQQNDFADLKHRLPQNKTQFSSKN